MDALEAAWLERSRLYGEASKLNGEADQLCVEADRLRGEALKLTGEAQVLFALAFIDAYGSKGFMHFQRDGSLKCPDGRVLAKPGGA